MVRFGDTQITVVKNIDSISIFQDYKSNLVNEARIAIRNGSEDVEFVYDTIKKILDDVARYSGLGLPRCNYCNSTSIQYVTLSDIESEGELVTHVSSSSYCPCVDKDGVWSKHDSFGREAKSKTYHCLDRKLQVVWYE